MRERHLVWVVAGCFTALACDGSHPGSPLETCHGYVWQAGSLHEEWVSAVGFDDLGNAIVYGLHQDVFEWEGDHGWYESRSVLTELDPTGLEVARVDLLKTHARVEFGSYSLTGTNDTTRSSSVHRLGLDGLDRWLTFLSHHGTFVANGLDAEVWVAGAEFDGPEVDASTDSPDHITKLSGDGEIAFSRPVTGFLGGSARVLGLEPDCAGGVFVLAASMADDVEHAEAKLTYVRHLDPNGDELNTIQFDQGASSFASAFAATCDGRLYSLWRDEDRPDRVLVEAWDRSGDRVWRREVDVETHGAPARMATDESGRVYLSVSVTSAARPNRTAAMVMAFDADGNETFAQRIDTGTWDQIEALAVSPKGGRILVGGFTHGELGGDHEGQADQFVAELCP